ncbi:hypothetical protein PS15m_004729 [Mucor circinelloides]
MEGNTSSRDIYTALRDIKSMLVMLHEAVKAVEVRLAYQAEDRMDLSHTPTMLTTIKPNFDFLDRPINRDIHERWNCKKNREDRLLALIRYQMKQTFEKHSLEELYVPSEAAYYQKIFEKTEAICQEYVDSVAENGFVCPANIFYSQLEVTMASQLKKYQIEPQRCENYWAVQLWCTPFIQTEITFGVQKLVILKTESTDDE